MGSTIRQGQKWIITAGQGEEATEAIVTGVTDGHVEYRLPDGTPFNVAIEAFRKHTLVHDVPDEEFDSPD